MITIEEYFGPRWQSPQATPEMQAHAAVLLAWVNGLLAEAATTVRYGWPVCPFTGTCVSGSHLVPPSGDGGFRGSDSTTGAPNSKHRTAQAVDVYDPGDRLDNWISRFEKPNGGNSLLERHGLYREHPSYTKGWCHVQCVQPGSGKRTFKPY